MAGPSWARGAGRTWAGKPKFLAKPNYDLQQVLDDAADPAAGIVDASRQPAENFAAIAREAAIPNMEAIHRDAVNAGKSDSSKTYFLMPSKLRLTADGNPETAGFIAKASPGDWFRQNLLGDHADGVYQRFIERNPTTSGMLGPHISSKGPGRNLSHSIYQIIGPGVRSPMAGGVSGAWWDPTFATAFINKGHLDALTHEMFHALLDPTPGSAIRGQVEMPVPKSKMWKQFPAAHGMPPGAMPEDIVDAFLKADAKKYPDASAMDQFDRPLDPDEYPFAADAAENAKYNRTAAEFRARLAESKWMQALHEGKFPETRAENIRLLQRLLDEDATYSSPELELKTGPGAGTIVPGFRTQQRALQQNWEMSSPKMKKQIEDLFYRLGSNQQPGAATYG